jgi:hypothetical protein
MGTRWLLAVAACSGLAWAGMVYGACNQELLHKLLDRGFSNEEILQMCGHPQEGPTTPSRPPDRPPPEARESQESKPEVPNTPSRPPDRPPTVSKESQESKQGARIIIRFEDDIANYIKAHQKNDPRGTKKFKQRYIEKQIHCISIPGSTLDTSSEELKNASCNEVHSSKKMRFYQCIKGDALERIILLFENDEHCRKSTEEIKELVETAYDIPR